MGQVLAQKRAADAIEKAIVKTLTWAGQRNDFVKVRVEDRLGRFVPLFDEAAAEEAAAERAAEEAAAALAFLADKAYITYAQVQGDVYNALGRPRGEVLLATVFPEGVSALRHRGPAAALHTFAQTSARLRRVRHEMLDEARCAEWASRLDAAAAPLAPAVASFDAARAVAHHARATRGSLARAAWIELPALKRELRAAGLTEAQVHTVIPSEPRRARRAAGNGHDASATALSPVAALPAAVPPGTGDGGSGASTPSSG
jgi:hypothetical protein